MRFFLTTMLVLLYWASPANARLQVFSCEPEWAELARVIGGNHIQAFSATTAQQDVHFIQARPSLIAKLRKADLLVCTGAGLEAGWLPVLQRRANNPAVVAGARGFLDLSEGIALLERRAVADRAEGDVHPEGNPHFHLDPRNLLPIAGRLAEKLVELDPGNAAAYRAGEQAFADSWRASITRWESSAKALRGQRVVAHHRDWGYLARWLGLEIAAMLEPRPGVPPTTRHLGDLLQLLETEPVACVIRANYQAAKASEWLAKRADIPAVALPYTVGGVSHTATLHTWFDELVQRLTEHCQ